MDLIGTLKRIEQRATKAAADIEAGRQAGLPVNGISALKEIGVTTRDLLKDIDQTTAGATKGARATTTPSSREGRA